MNNEIKEIFNKYGKEKYNDEYCLEFETYIIELQELKKIYDYITNLQEVADKRMSIILKIEQYLIDCGVDDEILKLCGIYDVNGVELRKYIEELKGE